MTKINSLLAGIAVTLLAACAGLPYAPVHYTNGLMTGANGMTLYTFDKDTSDKSMCNGQCATSWPPFKAGATDQSGGDWTIVTRDDGSKQWAWSGQPLYYWNKDQKPGDITGDGFNKVWHAVKPPPLDYSSGSMNGP
ncbi:MAG: hypothetical protein ABIS45_17425 [Burkholderiales bacterium]